MDTNAALQEQPASTQHQTSDCKRTPNFKSVSIGIAILGVAVAEWLVYQHYFEKRVTPFYPVCIDQVVTYLYAYWAHFQIMDRGLISTLANPLFLSWADPMKGPGLSFMAVIATFVLGPTRFSIGCLNLVFLLIGQCSLFVYFFRRNGLPSACLASGLFLLVGSHYLGVGGINDMRRDYLCMIVSGLTFLCVSDWLRDGRMNRLWIPAGALLVSSMMRSVVLFYWSGAFALSSVFLLSLNFFFKRSSVPQLLRRMTVMFVTSLLVVASNVLINLQSFCRYYLSHKVDGEEVMRWKEFGVHNLTERLLYYPNSFVSHFGFVVTISAFLLVAIVVIGIASRVVLGRHLSVRNGRDSFGSEFLLLGSLVISAMSVLTFYSPNPIVIGFLGMILCVCIAKALNLISIQFLPTRLWLICAVLTMVFGFNHFWKELKSPGMRPHGDLVAATTCNTILAGVKDMVESRGDYPTTLYWALVHDGLNDRNFDVFWYEEARKSLPVGLKHLTVAYFPATEWKSAEENLSAADIVVVPTEMAPAGEFEYAGNESVRKFMPLFQTRLRKDFRLKNSYFLPSVRWKIGVFERVRTARENE